MRKFLIILSILLAVVLLAGIYLYYSRASASQKNEIILYGNVDVRQVDLGFRVSGRVISMPFQEGDLVQPGTLVAELDRQPYGDQLQQAQATLESIKANFINAERVLKRRTELITDGSVSQEDYENAKASRDVFAANLKEAEAAVGVAMTNFMDTKVYAPSEGTILTRIREPGTVVKAADPVYTLSLTNPIWVRAFIPEDLLGVVYPGMPAEVYTDTKNGKVYEAQVGFISPVAEFTPKTVETTQLRTDLVYRLRIIAKNPDWGLRQGMPVTVKLRRPKSSNVRETQ